MEELFWKTFHTFQRQGNVTLLSEGNLIWTGPCIILDLNCVTLNSLLRCCPVLDHILWCHFCPNIWASKKLTRNRANAFKCNCNVAPTWKENLNLSSFQLWGDSADVLWPQTVSAQGEEEDPGDRDLLPTFIFNHTYWFRNSIIFMTIMQEAGGFVAMNGVWRVQGVLATSRALGDYPLKVWSR